MPQPTDAFIPANGIQLHYLDWGNSGKPPVVLVHGITSTAHNWDFVARALCDRYHVLAIDLRGHGESGRPPTGYRDADYVADLAAFVEALNLREVNLVGHSLGGRVAMLYAAQQGAGRVARLVVVDVGPDVTPEGKQWILAAVRKAPDSFADEAEARAYIRRLRPQYSEEALDNRVRYALRRRPDGRLEWRYDKQAMIQTMENPRQSLWDLLPHIAGPTLLVRGGASDILTAETAAKMLGMLPDGHFVEIPGAGHDVPFAAPEPFTEALMRFLED